MENRELLARILPRLRIVRGPDSKDDYTAWCEFHPDGQGKPPHEPNLRVGPKGFICHACGEKGSLWQLAKRLDIGMSAHVAGDPKGRIICWYDYCDELGTLLFQVGRKLPKDFVQRHPDGHGEWIWDLKGVRRVLYRLPQLLAKPAETVWVVEGEKDVDRLIGLGLVATTNPGGSDKWRAEYSEFLRRRDVVILPDNDESGRKHADTVAASLRGKAKSIKIVPLPDLPPKGDVSDWLDAGSSIEELIQIAHGASDCGLRETQTQPVDQTLSIGPRREPMIVNLADVQPESVSWLWRPFIPLGKLTILEGDPGVGKTSLALNLAAIVTRGHPFPDIDGVPKSRREPGSVVYLSAEDGLADTLRPRLDASGADVARVHALTGILVRDKDGVESEQAVTLQDIPVIQQALQQIGPALLVVDPLQAYLGAKVDMHRANETRPVLAALARLAERYKCAVLCIRHLGKSSQDRAVYRGLGSIDFAAAARSILLAAQDQGNPAQRVMAHVKSSLAPLGQSMGFELRDDGFYWTGIRDVTAEDLLRPPLSTEECSAVEGAVEFLEGMLCDGAKPSNLLRREARRHKISEASLRRAKDQIGVIALRMTTGDSRGHGEWLWSLPHQQEQAAHTGPFERLKESSQSTVVQCVSPLIQDAQMSALKKEADVQGAQLNALIEQPLANIQQEVTEHVQGAQRGTVTPRGAGPATRPDPGEEWEIGVL